MFRRALKRLHHDDRGNLAVLLLLIVFTLMGVLAMVYNGAVATSRKMRAQVAADAAAYAAAAWDARATNLIALGNMLSIRAASAEGLGEAVPITAALVAADWAKVEAESFGVLTPKVLEEAPFLAAFVARTAPAVLDSAESVAAIATGQGSTYRGNINTIYKWQQAIADALPAVINDQVSRLQTAYGCTIYLTVDRAPGDPHAKFKPPVRQSGLGDIVALLEVLGSRMNKDKKGWADSTTLGAINLGRGVSNWDTAVDGMIPVTAALHATQFHMLVTQSLLLEVSPGVFQMPDANRRTHFTYLATASVADAPGHPVPQLRFRRRITSSPKVTAYAQAELFNGNEGGLTEKLNPMPWRMWSTDGIDWRPRLAQADALQEALGHDTQLSGKIGTGNGLSYSQGRTFDGVNLH